MLSCNCDFEYDGDPDSWYWEGHYLTIMPPTAPRKRCKCCGNLINWGEEVFRFPRARATRDDGIEWRIYGDEKQLPPWYTCEECSDLITAVEDLGFCWNWGESIKEQIAGYRAAERECKAANEAGGGKWGDYTVDDFL